MNINKLIKELHIDQDYNQLELLENKFKKELIKLQKNNLINEFVTYTHKLGLIYKYKSYGVKCCNPLGYSIFLLNKNEGFSFQDHKTFKTELFHIIKPYKGGYVYLSKDSKNTNKQSLKNLYISKSNYQNKLIVKAGDVIKIEKTGIIHTAIGCILEEYANTSTDMVNRIYNQNKGRKVKFEKRKNIQKKLKSLTFPNPTIEYFLQSGVIKKAKLKNKSNEIIIHADKNFEAERTSVKNNANINTKNNYISLYCTRGNSWLSNSEHEINIKIKKGDSIILPPNNTFVVNSKNISEFSILKINKNKAFK